MRLSKNLIASASILLVAAAASPVAWAGKIDLSRMIDKTEAESVLGVKVKEPALRNIDSSDGYYSKCNYYSVAPGKTLLLRLYQAAEGHDLQKELNLVMKNTPAFKEISGIGDKAFAADGPAGALPPGALMLYVVKGNALLIVGLNGNDDAAAALEKAKSVGQKILAQL